MSELTVVGGKKRIANEIIVFAITLVVFLLFMFPFAMVLLNSFKVKRDIISNPLGIIVPHGYSLANYIKAFTKMDYLRSFCNSLFVTGVSTVVVVILSSMLAYYLVRYLNKFSKIVSIIMAASMIIPFQSLMIPLVSIYGANLNILNHRSTLIFFHIGFAMTMNVFIYQGYIKSNVPMALEEAAKIDGCGKYRTFFQIVFPLLKPITSTLVILNVLAFWNDYLLPSLVLSNKKLLTLPLTTYTFYGTYSADYGVIMAALVLTILPILVLYLVMQKRIISGVIAGAVK